jgi:multidrug transporter EmrE-like cation transporter
MSLSTPAGVGLAMVAGLMSGNCMLPSKFLRSWRWENMWAVFSLFSLVIFPWGLAVIFVGRLGSVYGAVSLWSYIGPVCFGMCWGVAQILFGISCARLGLSLAYAIIVGMGAALGTLVPMLATQGSALRSDTLFMVLAGILLMAVGIALSGWGGRLREKQRSRDGSLRQGNAYRAAILIAIVCGLMAPMLNYSFASGQEIARQSIRLGESPLLAAYSVWPIGLAGGFVPNLAYSLYLLRRNRSWSPFKHASPDLFLSALMAALWMGAFAVYGMSAALLGDLGTSIGWGLFQIFMIMTASLSGLLTGEWKGTSGRSRAFVAAGMLFLLVATLLLTAANRH